MKKIEPCFIPNIVNIFRLESTRRAGSRLTSNIKITLKIKFTSEIFADITRSLVVVLQHLRFCKKILILIFFSDLFSVECKFFCPNSADNTMENRAISLVENSRDNSLISCPTSSDCAPSKNVFADSVPCKMKKKCSKGE